VLTTPAVRALSKKHGIDLSEIVGTGKEGRITKEDVINFMETGSSTQRA
jgi:2-oxoisovalerate dehydrogenase E2 component (dihydrolipoyl transacylase)